MNNRTIITIIAAVILPIMTFGIGYKVGHIQRPDDDITSIVDQLQTMVDNGELRLSDNTMIEMEFAEGVRPSTEIHNGANINMLSKKGFFRGFSWFGLGANEAAVKDQGFQVEKGGMEAEFGQSKGYGFIEQLWSRIKSIFWFCTFGIVVLLVLLFIPATAPIAGAILRIFASIIPGIGSITERVVAGAKWEKPLKQTVAGGQEFKSKLSLMTGVNDEQKELIRSIFTDAMMKKQDSDSQKAIKTIKVNNGI